MKRIALALALSLLGAAASAAPDETRMDMRCVLAFSALMKNPAYKDAAGAGIFYFLGRLDGRDPKLELGAAMQREVGNMQTSDYVAESQRCGALLKSRNEALKGAGEALKGAR